MRRRRLRALDYYRPISIFWPIYLALFNVIDGVSTTKALAAGFAREANPAMRWLFEHWRPSSVLGLKIVLGVGCSIVLWCVARHSTVTRRQLEFIRAAFIFLCLVYTFVIGIQFALWHSFINGAFGG